MVLLLIGLAGLGAYLNADTNLFVPAAINAVISLWSNGVMANFRGDPMNAPNWAAVLSMATAVGATVFVVVGLVNG